MNCDDCGKELYKTLVCTNCGLVSEDLDLRTDLPPVKYEENDKNKGGEYFFFGPLSPDIEYSHKYAKKSSSVELNRALSWQKKERNKTEKKKYFRDYKDIERVCAYLQLPKIIFRECLNIRKQIGKNGNYFDRKTYYKNMACVKVATHIHDYPLDEKEFIQMMKGYPIIEKGGEIRLRGNEIKREIDRKYVEILNKYLKIRILLPKKPNFISYACNKLNITNHQFDIYKLYEKTRKYFNPSCSINGYILALIHLLYSKSNKIRVLTLEKIFGVNRLTITSRKKDLKRIFKKININIEKDII